MEDQQSDQQQRSGQMQQRMRLQQQQQQGGHMSKAARKQARKARKAATAARVEGLQGLDILAALGDGGDPTADDDQRLENGNGSPTGSGESSDGLAGDEDAAAAECGFSHLLSDDAELSMLRLAKELCGTFPNNVEQLVDLTGGGGVLGGGATHHQKAVAPEHTHSACLHHLHWSVPPGGGGVLYSAVAAG
jgi:hypothetical protein